MPHHKIKGTSATVPCRFHSIRGVPLQGTFERIEQRHLPPPCPRELVSWQPGAEKPRRSSITIGGALFDSIGLDGTLMDASVSCFTLP